MTPSLFALNREQAKQVFGRKDPALLLTWIAEELTADEDPSRCLPLDEGLLQLREQLASQEADNDGWRDAAAVVRGARTLGEDGSWRVQLVRPDLTPTAAQGARLCADSARENDGAWRRLADFLASAAEQQLALLWLVPR